MEKPTRRTSTAYICFGTSGHRLCYIMLKMDHHDCTTDTPLVLRSPPHQIPQLTATRRARSVFYSRFLLRAWETALSFFYIRSQLIHPRQRCQFISLKVQAHRSCLNLFNSHKMLMATLTFFSLSLPLSSL